MPIKELFQKEHNKILPSGSMNALGNSVESADYGAAYEDGLQIYIPPVDFENLNNFVHFGSAKQYYSGSFQHIISEYPFDGSLKERQHFFNSSSYFDRYVFEKLYPRTNGYISLSPEGWGTSLGMSGNGFGQPQTNDFIAISGTMNVNNIYDPDENRADNLHLDGTTGNTIEFWMKCSPVDTFLTAKETIFDLWNGKTVSHAAGSEYGRFLLCIDWEEPAPDCALKLTYVSGTVNACTSLSVGTNDGKTDITAFDNWRHYSISVKNANTTDLSVKLYINGTLNHSQTVTNGATGRVTGSMNATLGALCTKSIPADVPPASQGWGKISGSFDEFRYWKKERTGEHVYQNWATQVGGGTNTDIANTSLGVYYKFNEGITLSSSIDSTTLDYSGRLSHGKWSGYTTSNFHRHTGSAIVEAGVNVKEYLDPIIYPFHPNVAFKYNEMIASGSLYDATNTHAIYNFIPAWVREQDEEKENNNILHLTQIMASYFDTLNLQIENLPKIKNINYSFFSGSNRPSNFANRLLESHGLVVPEIFADASVLSHWGEKGNGIAFEKSVSEIKNAIYQNIYNNLIHIYKSKGTEKSFRNLIHCFGVGDELVRLKLYSDNTKYELKDRYHESSLKKKCIDLNNTERFAGTVYQYYDSSPNCLSFIPASVSSSAFTVEGEFIFPKKTNYDSSVFFETPFLTASLYGFHSVYPYNNLDTSWYTSGKDLQVQAVRDKLESSRVYFQVKNASSVVPLLTSSYFKDVYNNEKWNFAVRIRPEGYPYRISGSSGKYSLEFAGYNSVAGQIQNNFSVSSSQDTWAGLTYVTSSKKVFAGSHYTNFTGSSLELSDVKISAIRFWEDAVEDSDLEIHAMDASNYGISHPNQNSFLTSSCYVPKMNSLKLHWNFDNVTGSDSNGRFIVEDFSSGSLSGSNRFENIYTHRGRGDFFPANNWQIAKKEYIANAKLRLPENANSSDLIDILNQEEEAFNITSHPTNFYFSFEKSPAELVSEEMINLFAGMKELNNLIGDPVNKYRAQYNELEKVRQRFFLKVGNTFDVNKFSNYYKWIDESMFRILQQLFPASSEIGEGISVVVESHVLERNKYRYRINNIENKSKTEIEGKMKSVGMIRR
jgi:hypothetical protein